MCEGQKHSSVVAKVHYQKRRSREVVVKALECLQKLQGIKWSEVDRELNTRFSSAMSGSKEAVERTQSENARPNKVSPPSNRLVMQRNYRRMLKFTSNEDDCLKEGINRHGFGQWTAILRDPDYIFQEGRTADSLKKRAHSIKFL